jgi:hypothetical protein
MEAYMGIVQVRWNDGSGNLTGDWRRRLTESYSVDTAVGDFDGDGISDLAILAPLNSWPNEPRIAFLFGRRDPVSSTVSTLENADARGAPDAAALVIREIAPNPARGQFAIRWAGRSDEPATLELHDVAGRRVRSTQLGVQQLGEHEARFESLGDLPAGLYWIRIRQGNAVATKRVALIR